MYPPPSRIFNATYFSKIIQDIPKDLQEEDFPPSPDPWHLGPLPEVSILSIFHIFFLKKNLYRYCYCCYIKEY